MTTRYDCCISKPFIINILMIPFTSINYILILIAMSYVLFPDDRRETREPKMNLGASVRVNKCGLCVIVALMVMVVVLYNYGTTSELKREVVSLRSLLAASIDAAERGGRVVS